MSLQEELEVILESLIGVESVLGGLVVGTEGEFLASCMPEIYDYETLSDFTNRLSDMVASLSALGIAQTETVLNFEGIKLVVKKLEHGHLVIMCQTSVSMPLLNLSTNIVFNKVSSALKREFSPETQVTTGVHPVVTSSTMTVSMHKLNAQKEATQSKSKVVPKVALNSLESELAGFIGPAAKIVIKKAIKKTGGEGYSLTIDNFENFMGIVESKIPDSGNRLSFTQKAKTLVPIIKKS